ncbi:RAP domain [Babesia duncani]|uniref:RAP domain n=1 Tax=Babesia duncani TaxID=323732 RepID=A0AAD9PLN4_9APIC|nr:RAP domain [Babesia duncani]
MFKLKFHNKCRPFTTSSLIATSSQGRLVNAPKGGRIELNYSSRDILKLEANGLANVMHECLKHGKLSRNVWDCFISRAIDIKHQSSIKSIATMMHAVSKAKVGNTKFYSAMCQVIVDRLNPDFTDMPQAAIKFSPYSIYNILSAILHVSHRDAILLDAITRLLEYKLRVFAMRVSNPDTSTMYEQDDTFTFETLSGISNALVSLNLCSKGISQNLELAFCAMNALKHETFGFATPKDFSIIMNALVKMGRFNPQLYDMALLHFQDFLDNQAPLVDISMTLGALVKMHSKGIAKPYEKLMELVNETLTTFTELVNVSNVQCAAFICTNVMCLLNLTKDSSLQKVCKEKLESFLTSAIESIVAETDCLELPVLAQILKCATATSSTWNALLMLTFNIEEFGLLGSPFDVAQYVSSLVLLETQVKDAQILEFIKSQVILALAQFNKRVQYLEEPETLGLATSPAKPTTLYKILKEFKNPKLHLVPINQDWARLNNKEDFYKMEIIASLLNASVGHAHDATVAQFAVRLCNFLQRGLEQGSFPNTNDGGTSNESIPVATVLHALAKFRIRNVFLIEHFAARACDSEDLRCIVMSMSSLAKLAWPCNHSLSINPKLNPPRSGIAYRVMKRLSDSSQAYTFKKLANKLASRIPEMNLQLLVNTIFSLALVGFDIIGNTLLYKLMLSIRNHSDLKDLHAHGLNQLIISMNMLGHHIDKFETCKSKWALRTLKDQILNMVIPLQKSCIKSPESALEKSVGRILGKMGLNIKNQVGFKNMYCIDFMVSKGNRPILVEVDGPYHFFQNSTITIPTTRMKQYIITSHKRKLIRISHEKWNMCKGSNQSSQNVDDERCRIIPVSNLAFHNPYHGNPKQDPTSLDTQVLEYNKRKYVHPYNRHPNFTLGEYDVKNISFNFESFDLPNLSRKNLLSLFYAVGNIKTLHVKPDGLFDIQLHNVEGLDKQSSSIVNNNVQTQIKNTDARDGNQKTSLSTLLLHEIVGKFEDPDESLDLWFKQLRQEPLEKDGIASIVQNINGKPKVNKDPMADFKRLIMEHLQPEIPQVEPVEWFYNPKSCRIVFNTSIPDLKMLVRITFVIHSGTRQLIYIDSTISICSSVPVGDSFNLSIHNPYNAFFKGKCVIMTNMRGYLRLEHVVNNRLIALVRDEKNKFNGLYILLKRLDKIFKTDLKQIPTLSNNNDEPYYLLNAFDIVFDVLNIYLNGQHKYRIPLLVFKHEATGKVYLCHWDFEIDNVIDDRYIYYPWNNNYVQFSIHLVPPQYRNVAIIHSYNMTFDKKIIQKLVERSNLLKQYDIKGFYTNTRNESAKPIRNIIQVEKPNNHLINIVV